MGETIAFYGIGFGPVIPDLPAGRIATGLAGLAARIEARFGATPAVVTFAGPSPGFVGLYQINVMVPNGFLAPGQAYDDLAPVSIQLNGSTQVPMLLTAVER